MISRKFIGLVAVFTILCCGTCRHKESASAPQAFGMPKRFRCLQCLLKALNRHNRKTTKSGRSTSMVCDYHWTCEPPQVQRQWRLKTGVRRTKLLSNTTTNEKTPRRSRRSTLVGEHSTDPGRSSLGRRGALGANPDQHLKGNRSRCGA